MAYGLVEAFRDSQVLFAGVHTTQLACIALTFDRNIALNGCEVKCATKSLENAGLQVDREMVITTDLGVAKNKNLHDEQALDGIKTKTREWLDELS